MGKISLFGTDGIRGVANTHPMTPELAVRAGRAIVYYTRDRLKVEHPKIIIGRDTRISGHMLMSAVSSGICSMGGDVLDVDIMPTPGVAFLTRFEGADAGIVISASHNPFQDNGIKFFNKNGYKLPDAEEADLEKLILTDDQQRWAASVENTGQVHSSKNSADRYVNFLQNTFAPSSTCKMIKLILDCSNGATSDFAGTLFESLGFTVKAVFNRPDGKNINHQCGSQHPGKMAAYVLKEGADVGLAFDGDGDRLIAVDEKGSILTGDQIIAICALFLNKHKQLRHNVVVSTVMSNIGLGIALQREGIEHAMSDVGDRYVMEKMISSGSVLGGEDSGHIIFRNHHTTGDGMLAALQLLQAIMDAGAPLSALAKSMTVFPQQLLNVEVTSKPDLDTLPEIRDVVSYVEDELKDKGRVLVRYSGTQPVCRVMVEAPTDAMAENYCQQISGVIFEIIGSPGNK